MSQPELQSDESDAALDVAAWRPVLTGLNLMRAALIVAMFSFVFAIILVIVTSILSVVYHMAWLFSWALGGLGLLALAIAVFLLWGMGLCCLAPSDAGAKRYAQSAFVLALTTTALAGSWVVLEIFVLAIVSQDWFNALTGPSWVYDIFTAVLMLNGTLAVACWHRFLGAVAQSFGKSIWARDAKKYIIWICIWASCATAASYLGPNYDSWLRPAKLLVVMVAVCGAAPSFIWAIWLLFSVRNLVRKAFQADSADQRLPG